jgi:hypothetical protein
MNEKIANILKGKLEGLDFIDKIAGLARPIMINVPGTNNDKVQKIFPIACDVTHNDCISGKYQDLIPNSKYSTIIYFEDAGSTIQKAANNWATFNSRLNLICWMNLKKLGECSVCTTSTAVLLSILAALPEFPINDANYSPIRDVKIEGVSEAIKSNAIFNKYSYDEKVTQYLLYPFDFFMLNISVSYRVNLHCVDEYRKGAICVC